jgi:hypothetical protein
MTIRALHHGNGIALTTEASFPKAALKVRQREPITIAITVLCKSFILSLLGVTSILNPIQHQWHLCTVAARLTYHCGETCGTGNLTKYPIQPRRK